MGEYIAKKSLGQHFLTDQSAIRCIVNAIPEHISALEIGPGAGALTLPLLARVHALTVIEKDHRFATHWQQCIEQYPHLSVVHDDVLHSLDATMQSARPEWIVGNLPYNISGPLTASLMNYSLSGGMVLMYQREVAERLLAQAGNKIYGGLSVLARHHYDVVRLRTLPPGAFYPPPKVHSVVLRFVPHGRVPVCDFSDLQHIVRKGFTHRRKTIYNNFRGLLNHDNWQEMGIDAGTRPEQLDYAAWTRIVLYLQ